ncbi:MAG: hypothetical protein ABI667_05190, partial [Sphingomicrobium sp.]
MREAMEKGDAQMCRALLRLDELESGFANIESFEFRSAYPADVAALAVNATKALIGMGSAAPAAMAAHIYDIGRTANLLHAFRWTKRKAIAECLGALKFSLGHGELLPALVLARVIIEHIGVYALFDHDSSRIVRESDSPKDRGDWVLEVRAALIPRLMGTRIDLADYFVNGLKGKSRKGYEAKEGYFDQEAKDLLKGVDRLDKTVKGIRNAYEFLSEYGHPNYPTFQLGVATAEVTRHRLGFRMLRKLYAADRVSRVVVDEQRLLLRDTWELLVEAVERFLELDIKLAEVEKEVGMSTRSWPPRANMTCNTYLQAFRVQ